MSCVLCPVSCVQFSWCRLDYTTHNSRARIIRHLDSVVGVLSSVLCRVSGVSVMYNELTLFVPLIFVLFPYDRKVEYLTFYNAFLQQVTLLHFIYTD